MAMHTRRYWQVVDVATAEELAAMLTGQDWVPCQGFRHAGYLYLNDSTSENGAQEYAVVRESDYAQVESVTFGWVDDARGLAIIREITAGDDDFSASFGHIDARFIETRETHGMCRHCG